MCLGSEPSWSTVTSLAPFLGREDVEVIDARGMDFFLGYIPGSRRFPLEIFEKMVSKLATELADSGKRVVFVDNLGGSCAMSCARDFIRHIGQKSAKPNCKVSVLQGGFRNWEAQFAGHRDSQRYIARAPVFPGAPHAGLVELLHSLSSRPSTPSPTVPCLPEWHLPSNIQEECKQGDAASMHFTISRQASISMDCESLASLASLAVGDSVDVFSRSLDTWIRACVIAMKADIVKVQYFIKGKCCFKAVSRDSCQMARPAT